MPKATGVRFWGAGTARTMRPLWIAEELGLAYELMPIGPRTGETQTAEYTGKTHKQKIPLLEDDGLILSESVAIGRYLIGRYGSESTVTLPTTLAEQAKEDEWVCYIYGEIDETSLYVMRRHGDLKAIYGDAPVVVESAKEYAQKHLNVVADHMSDKDFVVQNRFGLADVVLVTCLDWAQAYGLELATSLLRYQQKMHERSAYGRAHSVNYKKSI